MHKDDLITYQFYVIEGPTGDYIAIESERPVNSSLCTATIHDAAALESNTRRAQLANEIALKKFYSLIA